MSPRKRKRKRFVVIGLGNFGMTAAETLHARGHDVAALDVNADAVDRVGPLVSRAAVGDGRQRAVLERLGAGEADAGVVSTGDDLAASVLATLALRDLKVHEIYVKVISHDHARIMDQLGVTETVFPERESAIRLAERLVSTEILDYIRIGPDFFLQEMAVPDDWVGHSLRELALPRRYRIQILAVRDMLTDSILPVPNPDAPLKESDTILVAGAEAVLRRLTEKH
jgi:trk system potassium uptake protein